MPPLSTNLRKDLERAVIQAREAAERGATAALQALAADADRAFDTLTNEQKGQRTALRARMRALGATDSAHKGAADSRPRGFGPLVEEVAYEQWHRMLFARFLAENELLIHPRHGVAVSLEECSELAEAEGEPDEWMAAAKFASTMLPGIFRRGDPSAQMRFAADGRAALEQILKVLPSELFRADDALGWVYQFWQTKAKDDVNKSERKIGGADIAPLTQLFTEDYMVRFLLENSLGAWWAARHPKSPLIKEWKYLRFRDDGTPAVGAFPGWPSRASEITVMDPCCGSGHFLVVAAEMLRKMRMEEEGLREDTASAAVLRDNLFGLEIDPRCTQIVAFALAFDAWKHGLKPPGAGGAPVLPNVACSGISVGGQINEWTRLAGDDVSLKMTLERLYELFRDAPDLGSLVNPNDMAVRDRMFLKSYDEVAPLVEAALAKGGHDPVAAVFGADVRGVARAGAFLAGRYTLVATNPPYLLRRKQGEMLKVFADGHHPEAKSDLATMFIERCRTFAEDDGSYALVTPQNWLFLTSYKKLRERLLREQTWQHVSRLGENGFQSSAAAGAFTALCVLTQAQPAAEHELSGLDASGPRSAEGKATLLREAPLLTVAQAAQLQNPDARVALDSEPQLSRLESYAHAYKGLGTGDDPRARRFFWELCEWRVAWHRFQSTPARASYFSGCESLVNLTLVTSADYGLADIRGRDTWGRRGVLVGQMRSLPCCLSLGEPFDQNVAVVLPRHPAHLPAIWAFCSSSQFNAAVRRIDQKLNVTNATLVKAPFDLDRWQKVAEEQYPDGLPAPYSNDPTQWLFKGTVTDTTAPLPVAVARLLGYRWPDEQADALDLQASEEGIVCVPSLQGSKDAPERFAHSSRPPTAMRGRLARSIHSSSRPATVASRWSNGCATASSSNTASCSATGRSSGRSGTAAATASPRW
jgi:N-6 DNA Methylase